MLFSQPKLINPDDGQNKPKSLNDQQADQKSDLVSTDKFGSDLAATATDIETHKIDQLGSDVVEVVVDAGEVIKDEVEELPIYIESAVRWLGHFIGRHRKAFIITSFSCLVILTAIYSWALFWPQSINFDYANHQVCILGPSIFPDMFKSKAGNTFVVIRPSYISLGHSALFSYQLCALPHSAPKAHQIYNSQQIFSLPALKLKKEIKVKTGNYSKVSVASEEIIKNEPISPVDSVQFKLTQPDQTFAYSLSANNKTSNCFTKSEQISCSLSPLKLAYGSSYQLTLLRNFEAKPVATAISKTVKTIDAAAITSSSIESGQIVYDKPSQIILQTNKTLIHVNDVALTQTDNGKHTNIDVTFSFKASTITVNLPTLQRESAFNLHIGQITASDKSGLEQPYDLPFTTSGGPKVVSINIPAYGSNFQPTIILSFDQALAANQNPQSIISFQVSGQDAPASYAITASQIIIRPSSAMGICTSFGIKTLGSISSAYGIISNPGYSFSSRTHCYSTFSIGSSVRGRAIGAYQFGGGNTMVLFIAAMHGNEQNSMSLLNKWISQLDTYPDRVPADRNVVVIPDINPDGVAANSRLNANGIDLNRNFPTNDWQTQVTLPSAPTVWTNDGGPNPLSELESQAIANFEENHRPRVVLTYHSAAGIIEPTDGGDADSLGSIYASKAGYRDIPAYAIGGFFGYTTTGGFEDWVGQKLGLPAILVELPTSYSDDFSRNLPAMWAMVQD